MAQPYVGEIRLFAGNFAPVDWALCNGALLPISDNEVLYALIGTTYGGDGVNTFALPNLQYQLPTGTGQGPGLPNVIIGEMGGSANVTLNTTNLPPHNHNVVVNSDNSGSTATVAGNYLSGKTESGETIVSTGPLPATLNTATVTSAGSGAPLPVNVVQPMLAVNYIIALYGIFPSQS